MQSVVVNNKFSDYVNIKTGIPQGSNLGPLIFLLFINDFKITTPGTVCNLYADDTAVYVTGINEIDVQNKLQKATDEAMKLFGDNKLAINLTKSYTMLLSSQPRDISLNIKVNNVYLKTSSSKAAISMIMEKPENEILLLKDILPCFYCYCFISE